MRYAGLPLIALLAIASIHCAASQDTAPLEGDEIAVEAEDSLTGVAGDAYYLVTRRDFRRCAYPICGGYYVKRVNRAMTQCAGGTLEKECYVADLDMSALGLRTDEMQEFESSFLQGHGLVRGELTLAPSSFGSGVMASTLVASEAWAARAGERPAGSFYHVTLSGVRCSSSPCPAYRGDMLNLTATRRFADLDLAASGADERAVAEGYEDVGEHGVLVAGSFTRAGGRMLGISASEFYTRLEARKPPTSGGEACGRSTCGEGEYCCNASCGICAPLDGACIQIACE